MCLTIAYLVKSQYRLENISKSEAFLFLYRPAPNIRRSGMIQIKKRSLIRITWIKEINVSG